MSTTVILPRAQGTNGVTPQFTIGTVTTGPAAVTQTGTLENPVLNFTIPDGSGIVLPLPISDVTGLQAALDSKAPTANPTFTGTVSGITSAMVGLGNVNNTSDANKPVSTATQAALDGKQPLDGDLTALAAVTGTNTIYYRSAANTWSAVTIGSNLTFSGGTLSATGGGGGGGGGDVVGPASSVADQFAVFADTTGKLLKAVTPTKALVGLGSVDNTSDAAKPVSTATQTALDLKAPLASPALTGTPTAPTATGGTNTTQLATTAFVTAAVATKANLASPTFTGTPAAPTATAGTSTTQLATTAFVTTADNLKANISDTINAQTGTTYTLVAGDNGKVIELNNAAAITLTCPVLTSGFNVLIRQTGAGQVTVATSSTTARNRQSHTKLAGQWAEASIAYRATNEFVFSGDTAA